MRRKNTGSGDRKTFKKPSWVKKDTGIRIYSPNGKLLYILGKGQSVDYQELCKKKSNK